MNSLSRAQIENMKRYCPQYFERSEPIEINNQEVKKMIYEEPWDLKRIIDEKPKTNVVRDFLRNILDGFENDDDLELLNNF